MEMKSGRRNMSLVYKNRNRIRLDSAGTNDSIESYNQRDDV